MERGPEQGTRLTGGYNGADFDIRQDLTGQLPDNWRNFNKQFIPVLIANQPSKTKVAAGLNCGMLWTICRGMSQGDIVLAPDGNAEYVVGTVSGLYRYDATQQLLHQRPVRWQQGRIRRADMSDALRRSGSIRTVSNVTNHAAEIESLGIKGQPVRQRASRCLRPVTKQISRQHAQDFPTR